MGTNRSWIEVRAVVDQAFSEWGALDEAPGSPEEWGALADAVTDQVVAAFKTERRRW